MYLKKASLDHLPINIIVYTGTSSRYMDIAAPERRECVPISSGLNPKAASPMMVAADLNASFTSFADTSWTFPLS